MADAIRLDVTELRLISLERDGQWLLDHHEAEQRDCCANFVDSANHLFADLFKLDRELCGSAIVGRNAAGVPSGLVEVLFLKSYFLALTAERLATWFERKGCPVGGVESLKTWLRELETYNRPSAETPERLEAERQITVAEVVQGKSIVEITTPVMTKVLPKSGKPAKPAQSTWDIVLAGKWYAQSSGNEHAKWRFECHTPAYVVLYEGQDYWLDITEHVDDTAMLGLVQIAGIERIVGLTFDTIQITDVGLALLANFTNVSDLYLCECTLFTGYGFSVFCKFKQLTILDLRNCQSLTDVGLAHVANIANLAELSLHACIQITDTGLYQIAKLTLLTDLNLTYCPRITDAGVIHITSMTQLTALKLCANEQLTDMCLIHMYKHIKLTKLDLYGCTAITDEGLTHLARMSALSDLDLTSCNRLTQSGIAKLQMALPDCEISC